MRWRFRWIEVEGGRRLWRTMALYGEERRFYPLARLIRSERGPRRRRLCKVLCDAMLLIACSAFLFCVSSFICISCDAHNKSLRIEQSLFFVCLFCAVCLRRSPFRLLRHLRCLSRYFATVSACAMMLSMVMLLCYVFLSVSFFLFDVRSVLHKSHVN